ncbi:MAG: hypothetical protein M3198_05750 [Actinomycetota bacterium]|nr:hypothetical protein [Actinomycetota bacterium]
MRGGISFWSILSGILVAFGAFILLSAILGTIFAAVGIADAPLTQNELQNAGIAVVIALFIAQFVAYLWGGYAAGRMARGSGLVNGLLVAVVALVLVLVLGGIVANVGPTGAGQEQFPLAPRDFTAIATAAGFILLAATLAGAAVGGWLGDRWREKHTTVEKVQT